MDNWQQLQKDLDRVAFTSSLWIIVVFCLLISLILLNKPETRDSDKKLIWEVWSKMCYIYNDYGEFVISKREFMKAPSTESCRRVRQQLQREDLLLGKNLIQPTPKVKKQREQLSKEKGFSFIQGKDLVFNKEKQCYEYN